MPPEIVEILPILLSVFLVAATIQGATGFGFGIFSVAALSLFVELKTSTPLLAILNAPVIFYVLYKLRSHIRRDELAPIVIGLLVGIPIGTFVLVNWPQAVLLRVLAVVLVLAALRSLRANGADGEDKGPDACDVSMGGRLLSGVVGIASGSLAGAFNTGGPPVIAYVYCRQWTKEQRTATLQAIFTVSIFTRIVVYSFAGLYDASLLTTAAVCLPATFVGMFLGYAMFRRFSPRGLELFVGVFLMFVAVKLMIWPGG